MLRKLFAVLLMMGLLTIMPASSMAQDTGGTPKAAHKKGGERHPKIRHAIKALEAAKEDLEDASHDFGGHRVEALEAVNNALKQLHEALEADKK